MPNFASLYRQYIKSARSQDRYFGFNLRSLASIEPLLHFLYSDWWQVQVKGLDHLPKEGPAVIVGNNHGPVPWTALMLIYALMANKTNPRRVHIMTDMDSIEDERLLVKLEELGFVPWSSTNFKHLIGKCDKGDKGDLVAIFPEGMVGAVKPFSERYRLREFDWTRLLPAIEEGVKIYPLATLGSDEAVPIAGNCQWLAKALELPAFPVSLFFPWAPFPVNIFGSLPVQWRMSVLKATPYKATANRDSIEETAKTQARLVEGEIQAELNRMLRARAHKNGKSTS